MGGLHYKTSRIHRALIAVVGVFVIGGLIVPVTRAGSYSATVLFPLTNPDGPGSSIPNAYGSVAAGGQVIGYGESSATGGADNAYLWSSAGVSDLNPSGFSYSYPGATDGSNEVGDGIPNGGEYNHALLWSGSAQSAVDLNPANFTDSFAVAVSGNQQVGYGFGPSINIFQALLWTGTASSAVPLSPADVTGLAEGTDGTQQVGYENNQAYLWSGTEASGVDLGAGLAGFNKSIALGLCPTQEVGYGVTSAGINDHALLWSGTAGSVLDLNPSWLMDSQATATNGSVQVGYGELSQGFYYAVAWQGTAQSAVDLNSMLPAGQIWSSAQAFSVDGAGDIFGVASTAGDSYAVEWSPVVPEPMSIGLLATAAIGLCGWRERRINSSE